MSVFRARNTVLGPFRHPFSLDLGANCKTAVFGPRKQALLDIIGGRVPDPQKTVSFPSFGRDLWPAQAIQMVKFGQGTSSSSLAPFVGARYESFRDEFDLTLSEVLRRYKPEAMSNARFGEIVESFDLTSLLENWYVGLSNGQSRRAQIAIALMRMPRLLVIDEPFLGLDLHNADLLSRNLAALDIPLVLGLRTSEQAPTFVDQIVYAGERVLEGAEAARAVTEAAQQLETRRAAKERAAESRRARHHSARDSVPSIEIRGLNVTFPHAREPILRNLELRVMPGERVRIQGPNGSGKSTLLALITADHPQSWSEKVVLFGEPREVGRHSYFQINQAIGVSSPELHAIFPKRLSIRESICTGFRSHFVPLRKLNETQEQHLQEVANKLSLDLDSPTPFGELSLSTQKLVLFARALLKQPRILILDEAFSGMTQTALDAAFSVLDEYDGAVLLVAHVEDEIPVFDRSFSLR